MSRTVLALRHVAFEDLGALGPLLKDRGSTSPSSRRKEALEHGAAMRSLAAKAFSGWLDRAFDAPARQPQR